MVGHSENKITSSRECFSLLKRMIMCNRFDLSINKPMFEESHLIEFWSWCAIARDNR